MNIEHYDYYLWIIVIITIILAVDSKQASGRQWRSKSVRGDRGDAVVVYLLVSWDWRWCNIDKTVADNCYVRIYYQYYH